ncbi:hypothetical protein OESDEN_17629 [Oesophagostomum dentatum]|uniref:Uncharacterized protein n=1 Tax=Oesophagostomum dentatum TaxID=61180 RepID=A0A0B1SFN4_OESDE|nr:hypothetical protein OESDEN_17629 [Oesophagostomum dentatum]
MILRRCSRTHRYWPCHYCHYIQKTPPSPLPDDICEPSTSHTNDPSDEITPHSSLSSQSSAFTLIRESSGSISTTPRMQDSARSDETVLEMDTNRLSQIEDSAEDSPESSTSSNANEDFKKYLREGTDWPLNEASTSSAPPTINRETLNAKQSIRNALERKIFLKEMKNRDEKESKRLTTIEGSRKAYGKTLR